ncbi:MAG: hypothetical protein ACRDDZ_01730 [Marinifilaceae bacterium]
MKMNRYIITVLYVMAGCAVSVPLNAGQQHVAFRGDVVRITVSETSEGIRVEFEQRCENERFYEENDTHIVSTAPAIQYHVVNENTILKTNYQYTAHKIRAPEQYVI